MFDVKLEDSLGMHNIVYLEQLEQIFLFVNGSNSDVAIINATLDGLELVSC